MSPRASKVALIEFWAGVPSGNSPLTQPTRALVAAKYAADYDVVAGAGVGVNGSAAAWRVAARAEGAAAADAYAFANQQPLVPLNASARYQFAAWLRLLDNVSEALLWAGLWEADDFNFNVSTGPTFGRLAYMNSSRLQAVGAGSVAGAPAVRARDGVAGPALTPEAPRAGAGAGDGDGDGDWTRLVIAFAAPPWPSYIDLRVLVFGGAGGAALVDDFSLLAV